MVTVMDRDEGTAKDAGHIASMAGLKAWPFKGGWPQQLCSCLTTEVGPERLVSLDSKGMAQWGYSSEVFGMTSNTDADSNTQTGLAQDSMGTTIHVNGYSGAAQAGSSERDSEGLNLPNRSSKTPTYAMADGPADVVLNPMI
jgi:hypothetical protein